MEIERGVKIEYGGEWEAGLSSGSRSTDELPAFTDEELQKGLGDISAQIERVFRRQPQDEDSHEDLVSSGTA